MAGRFRYTFDNFYELADEPLGWEDVEIVIKRNESDYGGLFLTYMTELQFWGDGYSYVNQQVNNLGYCFSTKIEIAYQCGTGSSFETVFVGFINMKNAEIDNEKCVIKANIERDDIYAAFLQQSSTDLNLGKATVYLPDGSTINPVHATLNYHKVESGNPVFVNNSAVAYKVLDLFNYLSAVYTKSRLPVVSDFFTLQYPNTEGWEIEMTGNALKSGDTVTVVVRNYFGIEFTKSQAFVSTETNTLEQLGLKLVNQVNVTEPIQTIQVQAYFDATAFANISASGRILTLDSWLPIEIVSVEVAGTGTVAVPTWTRTQAYTTGGKDLYVLSQFNETQFSGQWSGPADIMSPLSFKTLFLELDKIFALGMQLQGTSGNYVLRVEPLEYFYSQPALLRLENIMNVKSRFESDKNYNQVQLNSNMSAGVIKFGAAYFPMDLVSGNVTITGATGQLTEDQYVAVKETAEVLKIEDVTSSTTMDVYVAPTATTNNATLYAGQYETVNNGPSALNGPNSGYTNKECIGVTLDLSNGFVTDIEIHGDQTSGNANFLSRNLSASNKQDLFCFLQCNEDQIITKSYKYILNNNGTLHERWPFNALMTNHHKIINNYIRLKGDFYVNAAQNTQFAGQALRYRNDAIVKPSVIFEFDYFLSFNQIMTLVSDPQDTIEVDFDGNGIYEKCWIYEIAMNINSKKAKFAVYRN